MPSSVHAVPTPDAKLQQQQQQLQMPTSTETATILHRLVGWKLSRGFPWTPDIVKYRLPLRKENCLFLVNHEALFYKLLAATSGSKEFTPEAIAEAAEFCDFWIAHELVL